MKEIDLSVLGMFSGKGRDPQCIDELMSGGTTVLMVSHSIDQIERLCNRVLWLNRGKTVMIGDTKTVCEAYKKTER